MLLDRSDRMSDNVPKTAYELAMERLRQKDADAGIVPDVLTDAQRASIAEVRRVAEARIAELKILHQSSMAGILDPGERENLDAAHRSELQRVADDRERKIARIRESRA
jgi:hypothetical protein